MKSECRRVLSQINSNILDTVTQKIANKELKSTSTTYFSSEALPIQQQKRVSNQNTRPGLQALNLLNEQLQYESEHMNLVSRIQDLESENKKLHQTVESLTRQLEVQKKLRKYIEKQNPKYSIMDMKQFEDIQNKFQMLKAKYNR